MGGYSIDLETDLEAVVEDLRRDLHSAEVALDTANETVKRQEEKIKALADALWDTGAYEENDWHTDSCWSATNGNGECTAICIQRRAALRLAGRLP